MLSLTLFAHVHHPFRASVHRPYISVCFLDLFSILFEPQRRGTLPSANMEPHRGGGPGRRFYFKWDPLVSAGEFHIRGQALENNPVVIAPLQKQQEKMEDFRMGHSRNPWLWPACRKHAIRRNTRFFALRKALRLRPWHIRHEFLEDPAGFS